MHLRDYIKKMEELLRQHGNESVDGVLRVNKLLQEGFEYKISEPVELSSELGCTPGIVIMLGIDHSGEPRYKIQTAAAAQWFAGRYVHKRR